MTSAISEWNPWNNLNILNERMKLVSRIVLLNFYYVVLELQCIHIYVFMCSFPTYRVIYDLTSHIRILYAIHCVLAYIRNSRVFYKWNMNKRTLYGYFIAIAIAIAPFYASISFIVYFIIRTLCNFRLPPHRNACLRFSAFFVNHTLIIFNSNYMVEFSSS